MIRVAPIFGVCIHAFCAFLLLCGSATHAGGDMLSSGQLFINSWGIPRPVLQFEQSSPQCGFEGNAAARFAVVDSSSGGADLVVKSSLKQGRKYRFLAWLKSEGRVDVILQFRRGSAPYTTSMAKSVALSEQWQQVEMTGYYLSPDDGNVRIGIAGAGRGSICIASPELAESSSVADSGNAFWVPISSSYFGVHLNKLGRHNQWPQFDPGLLRLWDSGTTWAQLQGRGGGIQWRDAHGRRFEYYVRHMRKHSPDGKIMYTLGMTPSWAASSASMDCGSAPYGRDSCKVPGALDTWEDYIRQVAIRYGRDIDIWELWNEADIPQHWSGSAQEMVDLARSAKAVLVEADPSAKLVGPNITTHGMRFLNEFLNAGGGEYVDGLSFHGYVGRNPIEIIKFVENVIALQRQYGFDLPLWNSEAGPSCNSVFDDCKNYSDSAVSASADFYQAVIYLAAMGVKTFGYYTWEGAALGKGGKALVESDFKTPTATGREMSTIRTWLVGARLRVVRDYSDPDLVAIEIHQGERKGFVVWATRTVVNPTDLLNVRISAYATVDNPSLRQLQGGDLRVGRMPTLIVVEG